MSKIVDGYFHVLKVAIALCLAAMVVLVFGNVVLRYGFNTGITVSEELSRWFFVYLTFLGAIVAMREHGHLGVDTLVRRLPPTGKKVCLVVSQLLMLFATLLLLRGSWVQTSINLPNTAPRPASRLESSTPRESFSAFRSASFCWRIFTECWPGRSAKTNWSWSRSPKSKSS